MNKDFNLFMSQLQETNQTLDFFCDFDKISANVAEVEMSLNTLNYLIGKEDLEKGVSEIWQRDPKVFEVLGILIAVRDEGKKPVVDSKGNVVLLKSFFESETKVVEFLRETGLAEIFYSRRIKNLVDYVFGIETGLDTNARKNRSGHIMENTVARIFKDNGIHIALDDFGTGFSALYVLRAIKVDTLKVDRSCVKDIEFSETDRVTIKSIISVADSFRTEVCVEGVENEEMIRILRGYKISSFQGYYYSKPIPFETFIETYCK